VGFAGAAGAGCVCSCFTPSSTDPPTPVRLVITVNVSEVSMNTTTAALVALDKAEAAPRGPKAVWLPIPPNAPAMSALLPCCSSTTIIRKKQTITCNAVIAINSISRNQLSEQNLVRKRGLEPLCLSAPPPQDGVSANFTTSAQEELQGSEGKDIIAETGLASDHLRPGFDRTSRPIYPFKGNVTRHI
jgi:hypothetical protein